MDDETREWLRLLFNSSNDAPPPDIVQQPRATPDEMREHYLRLNEVAGTWVPFTTEGKVILDVDGDPIGVEPTRVENAYHGGAAVTRRQIEDGGLTPKDVPRLVVVDAPRRKRGGE